MRAITFETPGDEDVLTIGEVASPSLRQGEVLIRVHATSVNRADLLQRRGMYPPPPGSSEVLGLECSGEIASVADGVTEWKAGDRVMALLPGGGYAEEAAVDAGSVMRLPEALSFEEGGAIPEVFLTAFLNIFMLAGAQRDETVLIHGGGSGVGTAAILLCKAEGIRVIVTAGSDDKCRRCVALGAEVAINYRRQPFADAIAENTNRRSVDVILDSIGGQYLEPNIRSLAPGGRLVVIGGMGGRKGELDLGALLSKRLQIIGSTLRSRPASEKREIVSAFVERFGQRLDRGEIRPVIDSVLPLDEATQAHRMLAASGHFGKIVLKVR